MQPPANPSKPTGLRARINRAIRTALATTVLTVGLQWTDPTFILNQTYGRLLPTPPAIQQHFDRFHVTYFGTHDPAQFAGLIAHLDNITVQNPELLRGVEAIILHDKETLQQTPIALFRGYGGRAHATWRNTRGMMEICDLDYRTIVHELAHLYHNRQPPAFTRRIKQITGDRYNKDLGPASYFPVRFAPTTWEDGTKEPRNGFTTPYGATTVGEHIAEFTADAYLAQKDSPWGNIATDYGKYGALANVLCEYQFITRTQRDRILDELGVTAAHLAYAPQQK